MIIETIIDYTCHRAFVYQLLTTLIVYYLTLIVRFYIIRYRRFQLFKYYGIPGPELSLLDGNASMYHENDNKVFEFYKKMNQKYGSTFYSFMGDWPTITTTDPALLRHVFLEDKETFSLRQRPFMQINVSQGLLFCTRPRWRFFRRVMAAPFNRFTNRGQASMQSIEDSIKHMVHYIDDKLETANAERKPANIDMYNLIKSSALHIISELAIKLPNIQVQENEPNVTALDDHLKKTDGIFFHLTVMFPILNRFFTWIVESLKINGYMKVVYQALEERIETTKAKLDEEVKQGNTNPPDEEPILDILIRLLYHKQMTKNELFGNVETLLLGGYDSTATTLIYTLWNIAKYEHIQERLKDELMSHGADSKYLEQVLHESMRLYPMVVSFATRLATKSTRFNDLVIPQETLVIYNNYLMHRSPEYWEDPERFDPERFAGGLEKIDPIYFAPFGLGERKCIGGRLAMLQMKIILTELVLRYKLTLISPDELKMTTSCLILTKPEQLIKLNLEKRLLSSS